MLCQDLFFNIPNSPKLNPVSNKKTITCREEALPRKLISCNISVNTVS